MDETHIFPELTTERLTLNALTLDDSADIFNLFSNEKVIEHYNLSAFTNATQAQDLIEYFNIRFESQEGIRWAIRLKGSNKAIGTCGFNIWNTAMKSTTIGYDLLPAYWGKGIATEAVGAIIKLLYTGELACGDINRIQADTIPGNIGSEKVLTKLGFIEEGIRRESGFWKGAFHDLKCFGLLKVDFKL